MSLSHVLNRDNLRLDHEFQLRLLLEEICCDICRFAHQEKEGIRPEEVRVEREFFLGQPTKFADIRVDPAGADPYIIEVKFGCPTDRLIKRLRGKYGQSPAPVADVRRLVLIVDTEDRSDWSDAEKKIAESLPPGLQLDVWNERRIINFLGDRFDIHISDITPESLLDVQQAVDQLKGHFAFGGNSLTQYNHTPLNSALLWHFGLLRLRQLREDKNVAPRDVLPPGIYRNVAVVLADMCSFSSYVRDTPDSRIVRECLTSYYSKARSQIISNGGMLYQFVGDEVVGLFGVPDRSGRYAQAALESAKSLISIGRSISNQWQRQIDREQATRGLHIGIAMGDLEIVSLGPCSRTYIGVVGDCINVAARLMSLAGPSEVVATNSFYQALDDEVQPPFQEIEPVEAKNVGRIKAWRLACY